MSEDPSETVQVAPRPRRRIRLIAWGIVGILLVAVIGQQMLPPSPLPKGVYSSISPARFPRGVVTTSSQFIFGAPTGSGLVAAHPTSATVYMVGGNKVDKRSFEEALRSAPMHVYVAAEKPGEISAISISP